MAEDDGDLGVITLVAAAISMLKLARELVSPKSGDRTMVAIPSDMEMYVLIAAIVFAFFFGICAFLYRYAEHNAKHELDRTSNKMFGKAGAKFIGAEGMAIGLTAVLAFYGAAVTPFKLGIAEPELLDYILAAGVIALICGILLTVLFNEGISGLGKFLKQKVGETVEAAEEVSAAVLEAKERAEKMAAKMGLSKKQTMKYVAAEVAEAIEAEEKKAAEIGPVEEAPLEEKTAGPTDDIVVPLGGKQ